MIDRKKMIEYFHLKHFWNEYDEIDEINVDTKVEVKESILPITNERTNPCPFVFAFPPSAQFLIFDATAAIFTFFLTPRSSISWRA